MRKNMYKKPIVLVVIAIFLSLAIAPTMGTVNQKSNENLADQYEKSTVNTWETYKLLIIAPVEFEKELKPLVDHKEKVGISTKLVTLDDIYSGNYFLVQGRDNPEKIKYFIKSAIEEWEIKYVLLVGGKKGQSNSWYFPVRYIDMGNSWEPHCISDLYYADIYDKNGNFSSWDSDGDGHYAEWYFGNKPEDKNIDLSPDIAIGRLPCRNKLEVKIMVGKIIDYETRTYDKGWFKNMVVAAGDTYPEFENPDWKGYEGEYYGDRAIENMTGFTPIKMYTSDGTFTGQSGVINAIDQGCGFLYLVGHGNPMTWATHPPNNKTFIDGLSVQNMYKLKNKYMYPVCIVSGCHNNQFDVSIFKILDKKSVYRGESTFECWGWRMTRKIGGGSIATIGCTALGHTKEDKTSFVGGINDLEVQFFKQYGQDNASILGDTWAAAISWYTNTYPVNWNAPHENDLNDSWVDAQVVQTWDLIGDPSLRIGGYP